MKKYLILEIDFNPSQMNVTENFCIIEPTVVSINKKFKIKTMML